LIVELVELSAGVLHEAEGGALAHAGERAFVVVVPHVALGEHGPVVRAAFGVGDRPDERLVLSRTDGSVGSHSPTRNEASVDASAGIPSGILWT